VTGEAHARRRGIAPRGERLAGFIYGTIVVLSVIVASAKAFPHGMGHIAGLVVVTALVLWLAHVYAHSLGHAVGHGEHLSLGEVRHIAWREASIIGAAVPPVAMLVLGELGLFEPRTAIWAALGVGLAVLGVQGLLFARLERLRPPATLAVIAVNVGLGISLIALKVLVANH
jgi:hypothetical protein